MSVEKYDKQSLEMIKLFSVNILVVKLLYQNMYNKNTVGTLYCQMAYYIWTVAHINQKSH